MCLFTEGIALIVGLRLQSSTTQLCAVDFFFFKTGKQNLLHLSYTVVTKPSKTTLTALEIPIVL